MSRASDLLKTLEGNRPADEVGHNIPQERTDKNKQESEADGEEIGLDDE